MKHDKPHPLAGKTVKLKPDAKHFQVDDFGGSHFRVEDYWDRVAGKEWGMCQGNPACLVYAVRSATNGIPMNNEVLYGKIGRFGHIVHVSELETEPTQEAK